MSEPRRGEDPEARAASASDPPSDVIARLRERREAAFGRYLLEGEIDRGGQGAVVRVWDEDLRRALAMKVLLGAGGTEPSDVPSPADTRSLERFLDEAQVTGQLDHPGIVPVHELGIDVEGRVYFTMKLVKGRTLKTVLDHVAAGEEGWTQTRALTVLSKVCEAMSYAHHKGVVHRDLKPANVMVGRYGEVYVMDWGLAKVLGRPDSRNVAIVPEARTVELQSVRRERAEASPDSPLLTMDGDVVGTPAYMPPEQALGRTEELGPHSDVYAVGAMLYHLLAGHMPYVEPGMRLSNYDTLYMVQRGAPTALAQRAPGAPAELVAICERAMARERSERYPDMGAFAADLSAYLERRVVAAYETGAWAEARKWVARNRPLAASLAVALMLLVAGLAASLVFKARADENARQAAEQARIARANARRASEQERIATQRAADVLSLSASKDLQDLVERAETLWPVHPDRVGDYERWLADARALIDGRAEGPGSKARPSLAEHKAKLAELVQRARGQSGEKTPLEPLSDVALAGAFDDPEAAWWYVQLSELVSDLEALRDPETGLIGDTLAEPFGWGVAKRLAFAQQIARQSVDGPEARERWAEAIDAVQASAHYGGLVLTSQLGLLPIGADPVSGLWEFAHLQTGEPAQRGADKNLQLNERTGIVFVLLPGGTFWMGAQAGDPDGQNHDPACQLNEGPPHEVELSPFFLSKYEMTQGQWQRIAARNPSAYQPPSPLARSLLHPVEQVSWLDCTAMMDRLGLVLPSEAQWEYAARGGTESPWWTGPERESLLERVNIADQAARRVGATWHEIDAWPELDDGWAAHAPAGSFEANGFGLHEVAGNLWEWCRDGYDAGFYGRSPRKDPVSPPVTASRPYRGGSFNVPASYARSVCRDNDSPGARYDSLGLRPARLLHNP